MKRILPASSPTDSLTNSSGSKRPRLQKKALENMKRKSFMVNDLIGMVHDGEEQRQQHQRSQTYDNQQPNSNHMATTTQNPVSYVENIFGNGSSLATLGNSHLIHTTSQYLWTYYLMQYSRLLLTHTDSFNGVVGGVRQWPVLLNTSISNGTPLISKETYVAGPQTPSMIITPNASSNSNNNNNVGRKRSHGSVLANEQCEVACRKQRKFEVTEDVSIDHVIIMEGHSDKKFGCKMCTKAYNTLGALKMHIRTHTLPCKCTICGKAFSRPWLLQGHFRTHTGEKPFKCEVCDRAFADRSNLRAHMQTHSDTKKYKCHICQKTFSRMSLLTKHKENCRGLGQPLQTTPRIQHVLTSNSEYSNFNSNNKTITNNGSLNMNNHAF